MRISFLLLLLVLLGPLSSALAAQGSAEKLAATGRCSQSSKLKDQQKFGDFVIRIYEREEFEDCVEVLRKNRLAFARRAEGRLVIGNDVNRGSDTDVYHPPVIPVGTDITGLGKPDLILNEWSGGAHCCFTLHVLELSDHPREIAIVHAQDSDYAHFEDLDHNGTYEFVGSDFTFAYWHAGFLQSPAPRIVLRFNGNGYELAPDLMHKPAPSTANLEAAEHQVRTGDWQAEYPPPVLWETMLDLIYTGHSDLAWKFLDGAWIAGRPGKNGFLRDFCGKLATSPYFQKLRPTISSAPCTFTPRK